jgi:hypothetical protein
MSSTAFVTTIPTTGHAYDDDGNIRPVEIVCAERVANGQRVLTEYFNTKYDNTWREQVDTDRLNMADAWSCVLGQAFSGYGSGEMILFVDADDDEDGHDYEHKVSRKAVLHGFLSMPYDTACFLGQFELEDWFGRDVAESYLQLVYYAHLEAAWRNELNRVPVPVPVPAYA